jgi:hypothetical protein
VYIAVDRLAEALIGKLVDTFPAFLTYWADAEHKPLDEQIESWSTGYMSKWPELLAKQIEDYSAQDVDWRQIARDKVFPYLAERLPAMQEAHRNLLKLCEPVYSRAQQVLGLDCDAGFVVYVGIGCGAGWVTPFGDSLAILFGLESITECGWSEPEALTGLIAHEIGHLAHYHWRAECGKPTGSSPWWQLYEEGFAQYCESLIRGTEVGHQAAQSKGEWLAWCQGHKGWLAAEFLKTVDAGQSVTPFFGSWSEIRGKSQTGYFLGREAIEELEKRFSLKEIALLEDAEGSLRPILEQGWMPA